MTFRVVHENPFSDRILDEIRDKYEFSLEQFHSQLVRLLRDESVNPADFITNKGGLLELDVDRVVREIETRQGQREDCQGANQEQGNQPEQTVHSG